MLFLNVNKSRWLRAGADENSSPVNGVFMNSLYPGGASPSTPAMGACTD